MHACTKTHTHTVDLRRYMYGHISFIDKGPTRSLCT